MLFIRGINTFGVKNSYLHMLYIRTCSTKQLVLDLRVLYVFGSVHELESYSIVNYRKVPVIILKCKYIYVSVILIWISLLLFHISWVGNYSYWYSNPIHSFSLAYTVLDPNFYSISFIICYSGVYNVLMSLGFSYSLYIYRAALMCLLGVC